MDRSGSAMFDLPVRLEVCENEWKVQAWIGPGLVVRFRGDGETSRQGCCRGSKLEDDWPESIFPQVLIQLRRHLFTSPRRACLRAAMLSLYGHMRAPSHHPTFLSNCAARFLTKVVCASCIVPGCAQVALCKLLRASALRKLLCASALSKLLYASALRQLLRASALRMCSAQVGLRKLLCACSVQLLCASALSKLLCARALRQLLRASTLRMCSVQVGLRKLLCASALCNCSVQVALRKLLCASDSAQVALRKCCRSCGGVLRVLRLYLKVAILQPELRGCAPRTTFVLKSCDFPPGAAGARSAYYVCT